MVKDQKDVKKAEVKEKVEAPRGRSSDDLESRMQACDGSYINATWWAPMDLILSFAGTMMTLDRGCQDLRLFTSTQRLTLCHRKKTS